MSIISSDEFDTCSEIKCKPQGRNVSIGALRLPMLGVRLSEPVPMCAMIQAGPDEMVYM
jgi:hypothetical protein